MTNKLGPNLTLDLSPSRV